MIRSKPLDVAQVQAVLRDDEVLATLVSLHMRDDKAGPERNTGLVLAITKTKHRWVPLDLSGEDLIEHVAALRCGLDRSTWSAAALNCATLTGQTPLTAILSEQLPFDLKRAQVLYKTLLGGVSDLIEGRHLMIVPTWPLAQIHWHVLVAAEPASRFAADASALRLVEWLGLKQPITVLPSPASLQVLRRSAARIVMASRTWTGFGNPLLDGPDQRYGELARMARERRTCKAVTAARAPRLATLARAVSTQSAGTQTTARDIRAQAPLPETADELCDVADALGASAADVHIGADASKTTIKRLSDNGSLATYRLIHFATHSAKAGELNATAEPGLILTPSSKPELDDNGYLTATEIGELRMNADWVILSACNTASSGGDGVALSGLAQAFFYAGARSLLVSHWYVDSLATEKLVKNTLKTLVTNPQMTRSQALQAGMRELLINGSEDEAHPSKWAAFVVVGEGGR